MSELKEKSFALWERVTRKWWFFLGLFLLQLCPPYAAKGYEWARYGELTGFILQNSLVVGLTKFYPFFQVIPMLLIIAILIFRQKVGRLFSIYAGLSYLLFAVLQNISISEEYGLAVVTVNIIMFVLVAAFWFWEAAVGKNDFSARPRSPWKLWVVPPVFFAFWFPLNWETLRPDFNPLYLFTSGSALTFCMMTPLFLAVLSILHPHANRVTMRLTSLIGVIIGFYNMLTNFVREPLLWWNGVLHLPLVVLSIYALILSFLSTGVQAAGEREARAHI